METNDLSVKGTPVEGTPVADVVPFWDRIGEIVRYPAHRTALSMILTLAVCHLVSYLPLGFLPDMFVWVALYQYAFTCLRATANGRMEPPELALQIDGGLGWTQILLQFIFVASAWIAFRLLGPFAGLLVMLILGFAMPGAIMALAMDESLEHALNPATWLAILARIGGPYVVLVLFCIVFQVAQSFAQGIAFWILPEFLAMIVVLAIAHYVIVATFHLMGYLIHQYQLEVGYTPSERVHPTLRRGADPQQHVIDEADRLLQSGRPEAACDLLGVELRGRGGSEAVHARYRKLLAQLDRREAQLDHGRLWILALLEQGNERRAVDIARECLAIDPTFEAVPADAVARVARKAGDIGASQTALALIEGLRRRHPQHADTPHCELFAAKLLAERLGRDDEARTLLDDIVGTYPADAVATEAAAYRRLLDQVGSRSRS